MKPDLNPHFSIVIPTFNRSSDLVRCLESLVSQTYKNFEVIVCDNASTDDTKQIINSYTNQLNLQYIYLSTNSGGPARPRNVGASGAKGEWVCFLDSDDWYKDEKLEFISNLDLSEVDMVYHDLDIFQNGRIVKKMKSRAFSEKDPYHDLLFTSYGIPTSSVCVRKEIFTKSIGFSETEELIGLEDYNLWIELARTGTRFKYVAKALGYYFLGGANLSLNDDSRINRYKYLFQQYIILEDNYENKHKIQATLDYHLAWIYFSKSKVRAGAPLLLRAFAHGSFDIKFGALRILLKSFFKWFQVKN